MFQGLDEKIFAMRELLALNRVPYDYFPDESKFMVTDTDYSLTFTPRETPMRAWVTKGGKLLYSGNPTVAILDLGERYRQEFRDRLNYGGPDRELMIRLASQADLKKLADTGCHWKPQNPDQCIVHTLVSSCGMDPAYEDNTADFHPDGGSGCILSNDDYVFGIRCNHLIWMTGNHDTDGPGVLLVGNHKGALTMAILRDASFHY